MIGEILDMRPDVPAYNEDGTINMIDYYTKTPLLSLMDTDEAKGTEFFRNIRIGMGYYAKDWTLPTSGTVQYNVNKIQHYIPLPGMMEQKVSASVSKK